MVPADDKENAQLIVSQIILDTLKGFKMEYPKTTAKRRQELRIYPQAAGEMTLAAAASAGSGNHARLPLALGLPGLAVACESLHG